MANFDRSGMTQAGINLMGKAIGGATIQFTKLVLGDGEMTGEILDLQGVVSAKQNVDVTRIERNDNQCTVGGELLTSSVKQGFFWRECGLYALDPDTGEILYNYAYSTKPDYIASSDSGMMEEILVSMIATVGSNTNVNVTIDDSMVFATKKLVDKKPYYYNCVDDMKIDTSLKEGDMAITLGYYKPDDGGGSKYTVTNDALLLADSGVAHNLQNGLKAKLIIENETITTSSYGAIGNLVPGHNNSLQMQRCINYCTSNKLKMLVIGQIEIDSPLVLNEFISIEGKDKYSTLFSNNNIPEIIRIELSDPSQTHHRTRGLSIKNLQIRGNKEFETNGITFNSVTCIYNNLENIWFYYLGGACINIINDGSKNNTRFYSHNIRWEKLYSMSCSELIFQSKINGGEDPWVYGGVINDIHIEELHSTRPNIKHMIDLSGFHNIDIRNIIIEGHMVENRESILKSNQTLKMEQLYFEVVPNPNKTLDSFFLLEGLNKWNVYNLYNIGKFNLTHEAGIVNLYNAGNIKYIKDLQHILNKGMINVYGINFGNWHSGKIESNVVPNSLSKIKLNEFTLGNIPLFIKNIDPFYSLDREKYIVKNLEHPYISYYCPGTAPTLSLETDNDYGNVVKIISTNDKKRVFNGLLLRLPEKYRGQKLCVVAKFKWVSNQVHKIDTCLLGTLQSLLVDTHIPVSGVWNTSVGIWDIAESNYIRFDYDNGNIANENQTLYIADLKIYIGNNINL